MSQISTKGAQKYGRSDLLKKRVTYVDGTTFLVTFNHLFGHLSPRRTTSKPATSKAYRGARFPYKQE
jgi:hypothetical protein